MALDEALKCVENSCQKVFARVLCGGRVLHDQFWPPPKFVGKADLGELLAQLGSNGLCLRTASMEWNVPGKYGPHREVFFFLIQKEPAMVLVSENFSPFFNADIRTSFFYADVFKKCALIVLHLILRSEEETVMGVTSPGLRDEWKMGLPKESSVGE